MTDSIPAFISELIRAANECGKLTKPERANLLRRAATTIRDYRDMIGFSDAPANDSGPGDMVFDLNETARLIDIFTPEEIAGELLRAADTIKTLRVLMEEKEAVLRGE